MEWRKDLTGRLPRRPHYHPAELDADCEFVIKAFLRARHGQIRFPIETDDLIALLESRTQDFDQFADLTGEGPDVEGLTMFLVGQQPVVRIARQLSESPELVNRLRTTMTHELGHVHFHGALFSQVEQPSLLPSEPQTEAGSATCHRDVILHAKRADWLEWQAGYACGAFLMPATDVLAIAQAKAQLGHQTRPHSRSLPGGALIRDVRDQFGVSRKAAEVRLLKLGHLTDHLELSGKLAI